MPSEIVRPEIGKPPDGAPPPDFHHFEHGPAVKHWTYRDSDGSILFHVSRHEPNGNGKQIIPWTWSSSEGKWRMRGWPVPRPLYGLELLAERPDAPVMVVEGEKAADAAREISGKYYVVITWCGGTASTQTADKTPLHGRKLLLVPDADEVGATAMRGFAAGLIGKCTEIKILDLSDDKDLPKGFDAADMLDLGWDWNKLLAWAKPRAKILEPDPPENPKSEDVTDLVPGLPEEESDEEIRTTIKVLGGQLTEITDMAEAALMGHPAGKDVFQRGGLLVEVYRQPSVSNPKDIIRREMGAAILRVVKRPRLTELFTSAARFQKYSKTEKRWNTVDCPKNYAETYLERPLWKVRPLAGICEGPTLRPNGDILDTEGYDKDTGFLLTFGGIEFPKIKQNPSRDDALLAIGKLKEVISGFPFVEPYHRSVILSAMLTGSIRRSLDRAPFTPIDATAPGTGKSLLADVIAIIITGRPAPAMNQGGDEIETGKRVFASLLLGDLVLNIDNVDRPLEGQTLCSILTQATFRDRILGESLMKDMPTDILLLANGNNILIRGDLVNRALVARMDARVERPQLREFEGNLREEVTKNRPELLVACLTILRAFHCAKRPQEGITPWGQFESWNQWIRASLIWLGEPDPIASADKLYESDPDLQINSLLFSSWYKKFGKMEVSLRYVINEAVNSGSQEDLMIALQDSAGDKSGRVNTKSLGHRLSKNEGRIIDGFYVQRAGSGREGNKWQVIYNDGSEEEQTPTPPLLEQGQMFTEDPDDTGF